MQLKTHDFVGLVLEPRKKFTADSFFIKAVLEVDGYKQSARIHTTQLSIAYNWNESTGNFTSTLTAAADI